jgi:hypothetical protein
MQARQVETGRTFVVVFEYRDDFFPTSEAFTVTGSGPATFTPEANLPTDQQRRRHGVGDPVTMGRAPGTRQVGTAMSSGPRRFESFPRRTAVLRQSGQMNTLSPDIL